MNTLNLKLYNLLKNEGCLSDAKAQEFIQTLDELIQQDINNAMPKFRSAIKKDTQIDPVKWVGIVIFVSLSLMILGLYFKK